MKRVMVAAVVLAMAAGGAVRGQATPGTQGTPGGEITAALPVIPEKTFNVKDFGAVGDFKALDTDAFKKAVEAVTKAGGGRLIVPAGKYKVLPFVLGSRMDLHLEKGAVIKAPETFAEYGVTDPEKAAAGTRINSGLQPLISCAEGTTDLAITGEGTIDGSGEEFWTWSDKAARKYPAGRVIVTRPYLVALRGVQRLHVEGVTLTNSPMFHLVPVGQDITIENVTIKAPHDAPNTDAMDPGGQRIVIRHCTIDTGDDDVAVKNGARDVLIEDLTCLHGHGISIGSGTKDGLSHMVVRRCTFDGTDNGLRIKSYRGNGGDVHDIWYSDITMKNVRRPIDLNMLYNGNANTPTDVGPREAAAGQTTLIPRFHDIHFTNVTVVNSPLAGRILGLPEQPASDITLTNVKIQSKRGFLVQDGKDIVFDRVEIQATEGEPLVLDNGVVTWNGVVKSGTSGGPAKVFY
jgi:polygalacturonase